MKSHPITTKKSTQKGQAHAAVDLSEPRNLLRLATFVTLGSVACSLVIGACWGSLDSILASLAIAGVISLIFWLMSLFALAPILIFEIARWLFRRVARRSTLPPDVQGGVADEWLDGPP